MFAILLSYILSLNFKKYILSSIFCNNTSVLCTVDKNNLCNIVSVFKKSNFFNFKSLVDMFGVDFLGRGVNYRFIVYYVFYNRDNGVTLTLKAPLNYNDIISSVVSFYNSASWLEREVFDMYGIFFYRNNDMRRILSDYGFDGFPLRKDFPLTGFFEVQYSEEEKVVVSQNTRVTQALRLFHFSNVWDLTRKKIK